MSKINSRKLRSFLSDYGIIAVLLLLILIFSLLSDRFLMLNNIMTCVFDKPGFSLSSAWRTSPS